MDPELAKKVIAAIESGDTDALAQICKDILAAAASGGAAAPAEEAAAAADDPAAPNAEEAPEEEPAAEMASLGRLVCEVTGQTNAGEALKAFRDMSAKVAQLAADRQRLEDAQRVELVTRLVACRAETPATAWARDEKGNIPEGAARKPCARLAAEPIDDLRSRVVELEKASGVKATGSRAAHTPPARPIAKLSKAAEAFCKKHGITAEEFNARKEGAVRRSA